jgi:ABC-2 type transport system permease protein
MAVYKRTYKGYFGAKTSSTWRWLILTRYSHSRLFQSKLLALFLALCVFYPVACIGYMYLLHNPSLTALLNLPVNQMPTISGGFFYYFCMIQGGLALLLTAIVGPALISPDIVNGALPLYFCRPFTRIEYVAGKFAVLLSLLSLITWIPGAIIFWVQAEIAGWDWAVSNLYLANSLIFGLLVWIIVLSLITLALSSWVKWRIAASAFILAIFFAGAGFGTAINDVMRTSYGTLIDLSGVIRIIWADILRYDSGAVLPAIDAWVVLGIASLICCWLLSRRIRPFEVVT